MGKGIALVTALFLMVVLLIIGLAFQTELSHNYRLMGREKNSTAAFYLARGGMEYYSRAGIPDHPIEIPEGDNRRRCSISQDAEGNLVFQGMVTDFAGTVVQARTLVARRGDLHHWYER